jgi:hypothetical protein
VARPIIPDLGTTSVVIATYNRPDALVAALRSVQAQTYPIHEIIVVGDCCDEATGSAVLDLADPRIRYINLETRHGDQSGPNARGVIESTGQWVAFLNHDDFWFPEHVHNALIQLSESGKAWYCGQDLVSAAIVEKDGVLSPVVNGRGSVTRNMATAYVSSVAYMEPASSWVVSRTALFAAGNWPFAGESVRTPAAFLALNLWRKAGEPTWGRVPSVLKVQGMLQQLLGGVYTSPSPVHQQLKLAIESTPHNWFEGLDEDLTDLAARSAPLESNFVDNPISPLPRWARFVAMQVFRLTGFDFLGFRLQQKGNRRGYIMDQLLLYRTGEVRDSVRPSLKNQGGVS